MTEHTAGGAAQAAAIAEGEAGVPVLRPRLPSAEGLLPYLRRIDASRIYSNWGPLSSELERRLSERMQLPAGGVTSASSGTAALVGAILATAGRATEKRPFALIPSFTFVATAVAVEQCGYRPFLADVDAESWMPDPGRLANHPTLDRIGLAVPVAPFGRPVPLSPWREFREATGIPIVIDGAASFDRIAEAPRHLLGDIPVALSFHATKFFATGEGGGIASTDTDLVLRATEALNFGFSETREVRCASINGKMSEYHAAVGLAELDGWSEKLLAMRAVAACYRRRATEAGISDRLVLTPDVGASYALFRCRDAVEARRVQDSLSRSRVGWRLWYGEGLHREEYFAGTPRERLEVTDSFAPCLLGIPLAPDLTDATVALVVDALARGV